MSNTKMDVMLTTTFSTVIAFALFAIAHLIDVGHILNPNWNFAVYLLCFVGMGFIALPYLCVEASDRQEARYNREIVTICDEQLPVRPIRDDSHWHDESDPEGICEVRRKPMTGNFTGEHYA